VLIQVDCQDLPPRQNGADPQNQKAVSDHCSGDAHHHQVIETAFQCCQSNHQLQHVAEGDVQQSSQSLTHPLHQAIHQFGCDLSQWDQGQAAEQEVGHHPSSQTVPGNPI
jgi:hypothetical protein